MADARKTKSKGAAARVVGASGSQAVPKLGIDLTLNRRHAKTAAGVPILPLGRPRTLRADAPYELRVATPPKFIGIQPGIGGRDGGLSTRIGRSVLWVYGDTIGPNGKYIRWSSTASVSDRTDPLDLVHYRDGQVEQFIPYEEGERPHGDPHIALWPVTAVPTSATTATVLFGIWKMPGYDLLAMKRATVELRGSGKKMQMTVTRHPETIFEKADLDYPLFDGKTISRDWRPTLTRKEGGVEFVYLVATKNIFTYLARVPIDRMHHRKSYEFWVHDYADPQLGKWTKDIREARAIAPTNLGTIERNTYLGREQYLSTAPSYEVPGCVAIRHAPSIMGPWSTPAHVPVDAPEGAYLFNWHPAFGDGQTITLTYCCKNPAGRLEMRVYELTLTKVRAGRSIETRSRGRDAARRAPISQTTFA